MHILHTVSHHLDFAMAVHWSGRRPTLSRLERLRPASLSCDWQPDGTEAGCPTSRKATHQREMGKGERHTVYARACVCVCVVLCWQQLWWILHLHLCISLWCQHERKEEIKIGFDRWKNGYRLIFSPLHGWINTLDWCRSALTHPLIGRGHTHTRTSISHLCIALTTATWIPVRWDTMQGQD